MDSPIGVFDSGYGGLTVMRAILDQLPHESVAYFGDTDRAPYGPRPIAQTRAFALECLDRLVDQGESRVERGAIRRQQSERAAQQGIDQRRRAARCQLTPQRARPAEPAQRVKAQCLHARAQRRIDTFELRGQRAPGVHALHQARHLLQLAPQRWR